MIKYRKKVKHHFKMNTKDLTKIVKIMRKIIAEEYFLTKEETADLRTMEKTISEFLEK